MLLTKKKIRPIKTKNHLHLKFKMQYCFSKNLSGVLGYSHSFYMVGNSTGIKHYISSPFSSSSLVLLFSVPSVLKDKILSINRDMTLVSSANCTDFSIRLQKIEKERAQPSMALFYTCVNLDSVRSVLCN